MSTLYETGECLNARGRSCASIEARAAYLIIPVVQTLEIAGIMKREYHDPHILA